MVGEVSGGAIMVVGPEVSELEFGISNLEFQIRAFVAKLPAPNFPLPTQPRS